MWIRHIPFNKATGRLKQLYDRLAGPDGNVDNIMLAHSARPHSMEGHMALYKNVLHHSSNTVPKWFLECIGVWVSVLNRCDYCVEHHYEGMRKLIRDDARSKKIRKALEASEPERAPLTAGEIAALEYADAITSGPAFVDADDIVELREKGWDDGQILEINQVAAYFNYANRTVLGLGVTADGDVLGTSPSGDDPEDWGHR